MIDEFIPITQGVKELLPEWEIKLSTLPEDEITQKRNTQDRCIKQILGHMIDSVSNNIHRIIHLQYQSSPLQFHNYASQGNNDRWIAIQHYDSEDWNVLIQLWKYYHLHFIHIVHHIDSAKLDNVWDAGLEEGEVSLRNMVLDFLRHFKLHLKEIEDLLC